MTAMVILRLYEYPLPKTSIATYCSLLLQPQHETSRTASSVPKEHGIIILAFAPLNGAECRDMAKKRSLRLLTSKTSSHHTYNYQLI